MNKILKITSYIVLITFLFSQIGFADTIYFYHTDPAGTPIAMTDASGSVVWKADYKPFGEEWSVTSNIENNKRFVGKEKDTETGLNYFGARYMNSNIGRFISTDPVGPVNPATGKINQIILSNPQRLNLYSYGLNNPYKYVDTDGKFAFIPVLIVLGLIELGELMQPQTMESPHSDSFIDKYSTDLLLMPIGVEYQGGKLVAQGGQVISGFTKHGINRAIERNIKPKSILDALKNPLKKMEVVYDKIGRPSQRFIGKEAEVVINPETGTIVSVNKTSTKTVEQLTKKTGL